MRFSRFVLQHLNGELAEHVQRFDYRDHRHHREKNSLNELKYCMTIICQRDLASGIHIITYHLSCSPNTAKLYRKLRGDTYSVLESVSCTSQSDFSYTLHNPNDVISYK